jgi:hypothetical protein
MRGGARLVRRLEAAERGGVLVKPVGGLLGDFCDRLVQGQIRIIAQRAGVDLVVHVGDVAHIGDVALAIDMAQQPVEHIKHDQRPGIADMGIVIDRRSADIHADILVIDRLELFLGPRQRVPEFELGHVNSPIPAPWPGSFVLFVKEDENGRASEALANNDAADAGGACAVCRFHAVLIPDCIRPVKILNGAVQPVKNRTSSDIDSAAITSAISPSSTRHAEGLRNMGSSTRAP